MAKSKSVTDMQLEAIQMQSSIDAINLHKTNAEAQHASLVAERPLKIGAIDKETAALEAVLSQRSTLKTKKVAALDAAITRKKNKVAFLTNKLSAMNTKLAAHNTAILAKQAAS